jgi:hypothetical protein
MLKILDRITTRTRRVRKNQSKILTSEELVEEEKKCVTREELVEEEKKCVRISIGGNTTWRYLTDV